MTQPPAAIDRAWLDQQIAAMIDEDEVPGPDDNLIHYGLDSVRVMEFACQLGAHGIEVGFSDLIEAPTKAAWWALIEARRGTQVSA